MFIVTSAHMQRIAQYVRSYLARTVELYGKPHAEPRAQHRWMHTLNVLKNIRAILESENSPQDVRWVCEAAALFHDIDHYTVDLPYHGVKGAETATRYLKQEGFDPEFIKRVACAVHDHYQDWTDERPTDEQVREVLANCGPETLMLIDAETLDKIGVSNIMLMIRSLYQKSDKTTADISHELTAGWVLQRARSWYDTLLTSAGKKMGAQRLTFCENFMNQLVEEMVLEDPYPLPSKQTQEMMKLPEQSQTK
ncbi:hypothetical protein ARNL5_01923 [Anaerolineae bacterium]|nr:HD domain-containing protein [Anaerolinea sp.]MCC6974974.1 HD domain-containing protein [Anaerolineae bacterium]CAG0974047.1 hypothetical protein ARNL5_01923 [Anaerolineae bacterium]